MKRIAAVGAAALTLVALSLFSWSHAAAAGDEPTLVSAFASFHTNDDDKDHDTILTISIEKGNDEYARVTGITGTFHDHSNNGPFGVNVEGTVYKSEVNGATTTLEIQANGNDTWRFNYFLDLQFSDGSHKRYKWFRKELKEDRNFLTLGL